MDSGTPGNFVYWKRTWQKWLILIAGLLQLMGLWLGLNEYQDAARVKDLLFSPAAWDGYAAQQSVQCAISGLSAAIFLGIFLIGMFARSLKSARRLEGVLLLVSASAWGIAGLVLPVTSRQTTTILWALFFLLLLAACVGRLYSCLKSRKG